MLTAMHGKRPIKTMMKMSKEEVKEGLEDNEADKHKENQMVADEKEAKNKEEERMRKKILLNLTPCFRKPAISFLTRFE